MRRVETSWKLIEGVLWEHAHGVYKALRKPATDAAVGRLEKALGARLPADFKRSLGIHDGLSEAGRHSFLDGMVLLSVKSVTRQWKMRCKVHREYDAGGCPLTTDRRIRNDRWWRPGWVPIMEENGNMLLIDLDPGAGGEAGQVFKFYNSPVRPREVVAGTFAEWLDAVAEAFAAREFRLSEYGQIWLNDLKLT